MTWKTLQPAFSPNQPDRHSELSGTILSDTPFFGVSSRGERNLSSISPLLLLPCFRQRFRYLSFRYFDRSQPTLVLSDSF
jgi:hypothetical protein